MSLPAALLTAGAASTAVPIGLTATTAQAATAFAIGGLACSVPAAVAEVVLGAALATKLRTAAVLLFGPLLATAGWGVLTLEAGQPAAQLPAAPGLPAGQVAKTEPAPARTDRYGDPLPEGAVARLGSIRLFDGESLQRVTYSPDGKVVVSSTNGHNHFWDAATGAEMNVPALARSNLVFPAAGRLMAVEWTGDALWFRDVPDGKLVRQWNRQQHNVEIIGLGPDGKSFVVGHYEYLVGNVTGQRLRFGRIGEESLSAPVELGQGHQPMQVVFAADGKTAAVRCAGGLACTVDVVNRKEIASFYVVLAGNHFADVALSPDGSVLASAASDGIGLFDSRTGKKIRSIPGWKLQSVTFSPDGKLLAATDPSETMRLWDPATGKEVRSIRSRGGQVYHTAFSPDGQTLAMSEGPIVSFWDIATGQPRPQFDFGHTYTIWTFAFSPDGKSLVSGADQTVRLWDPLTGVPKGKWDGGEGGRLVESVAFTPDGRLVASGSQDGTIRLWDVAANREVRKLAGTHGMVYAVSVAPDGRTLAAAHLDGGVHLWDVASGRELRALDQLPKRSIRLAFSPDGRSLASYEGDANTVTLTDVASGRTLRQCAGHTRSVTCVAFSRDGRLLATGSWDGTVRIWDAATGEETAQLAAIAGDRLHPEWCVYSVAFAPDGRSLGAGYQDNAVRLWEVASRTVRAKFEGHRAPVLHVEFSPDGSLLASGGGDYTILTWDMTGRRTRRLGPAAAPPVKDADKLWAELADADAARAYAVLLQLSDEPRQAVLVIGDRLQPATKADEQRVRQLIADLGSERFATRNQAERELVLLGDSAGPTLREALQDGPSAEVRQRLTTILEKLTPTHSVERLREVRAVEALERIGTPEARQVLQRLASGEPTALLTREAKAALEHLSH